MTVWRSHSDLVDRLAQSEVGVGIPLSPGGGTGVSIIAGVPGQGGNSAAHAGTLIGRWKTSQRGTVESLFRIVLVRLVLRFSCVGFCSLADCLVYSRTWKFTYSSLQLSDKCLLHSNVVIGDERSLGWRGLQIDLRECALIYRRRNSRCSLLCLPASLRTPPSKD